MASHSTTADDALPDGGAPEDALPDGGAPDDAEADDAQPGDGRQESVEQKADRNWSELLQEMRVMQTGTQLIAAFLLSLPFQTRFQELDNGQRSAYLTLVALAAVVTALTLTPISLHRGLFRRRLKERLVDSSSRFVKASLAGVALLVAGTAAFVFDIVLGHTAGIITAALLLAAIAGLWVAYPLSIRRRNSPATDARRRV
jgi:hypothetical protein